MSDNMKYFLLGMFGALVPEIYRLYKIKNRKIKLTPHYFIICPLFAVIGGVIAVILPASSLWAAFYIGLSTETLIGSIGKKSVGAGDTKDTTPLNVGNSTSNTNNKQGSSWMIVFKDYFNAL